MDAGERSRIFALAHKIKTSGHRGSAENIEKLGFKILVIQNTSENHETWHGCHVMVLPCWGKKLAE